MNYSQGALFDLIEVLHEYMDILPYLIGDILRIKAFNDKGNIITRNKTVEEIMNNKKIKYEDSKQNFRIFINKIIKHYKDGFYLNENGQF